MYIRYSEIFDILALLCPVKMRNFLRETGYNLKVSQNLNYINKNKKKVLRKLRNKAKKGEKLNVAFYIYDETKWKCQSIYDLMEQSEYFIPHVFATKNCSPESNFNYQPPERIKTVYEFFKNKGMRVSYAYDFEKDDYIPFEKMTPKPDMVYYCHPWYVYKTQGPVMASKYALTYYSAYSVPSSMGEQEYNLRFYKYVETQYVLNNLVKDYFSSNMDNHGINLKVAGHPVLDYFYLNKDRVYENKNSIIYAPHFTVIENTGLRWGTFLQMGEYILDYAKSHPEFNWVFKPHPCLKSFLLNRNLWSKEKTEDYWKEWEKIGLVYESGDYLDMFMESKMMITDCGSFQTEYFMTQKPQIYLKSKNPVPLNPSVEQIKQTSYKAENTEELGKIFQEVLINNNDYNKDARREVYENFGYQNNYAARNILKDMEETAGINV